ncbi:MAG: hypothetical protein ACXVCT_11090, partial [Ktedonobacterales bacterium]
MSFSTRPSVALSFGVTGAVRQSASTAWVTESPSAYDATAPCTPVQNWHSFRCEVKAANSS